MKRKQYETVGLNELWQSAAATYELTTGEKFDRFVRQAAAVMVAGSVVLGASYEAVQFFSEHLKTELELQTDGGHDR